MQNLFKNYIWKICVAYSNLEYIFFFSITPTTRLDPIVPHLQGTKPQK
jgi:hypothetical protein